MKWNQEAGLIDNRTRSHRSRVAIIEAALHVLARNGAGQLTLDAVAREAGISKRGLMHQFRTKEAIIKALLEHHITYIETFQKDYLLENGDGLPQPELSAEIAGDREATTMPHSIALAVFGAMAEDQHLLAPVREHAKCRTALLRSEAEDPDEAMMKWFAGKGILFCSLLGINPLDDEGVDRLFRQLEKTGERG